MRSARNTDRRGRCSHRQRLCQGSHEQTAYGIRRRSPEASRHNPRRVGRLTHLLKFGEILLQKLVSF